MSLDTIYADGIDSSIDRWLASPGPEPEQGFSATSFLSMAPKGLVSGALEATASFMEMVAGIQERNIAGAEGPEVERRQEVVRQLGESAAAMRRRAIDSVPDPETTHTADQVVHGLFRFGGKAVGAVGTMGPAGVVPFGVEEGNTAAQTLMQQGVDPATAAKVGVVQGGIAGASVLLPISGKTVLQTIGLVTAGGPAAYVAQETLVRDILQRAGRQDLASLHNPWDPLGLTLSTVIPGMFGAVHMRGVRTRKLEDVVKHIESGGQRFDKSGQILTSPKGAQGEMQVMPGTARDPGFGVTPAKDDSPDELARVGRDYLGAMVNRYGELDKALAAYNAGPGAVDAAVKAKGDAWLEAMPKETRDYVAKARKLMGEYAADEGARSPEVVDAARVAVLNDVVGETLPDAPDAMARVMRAADIVDESGGRAAEAEIPPLKVTELPQFRAWFGDSKVVDETGAPLVVYHGTADAFDRFGLDEDVASMNRILRDTDMAGKMDGRFFFADRPDVASEYAMGQNRGGEGANVLPVYVALKDPLIVDAAGARGTSKFELVEDAIGRAVDARKDGVILRNVYDHIADDPSSDQVPHTVTVAFKREQVKSALGNSGKFDPNSPSLTDPLKPGEAPIRYRDATNSLPDPDSVSLAGDQPAKAGKEMTGKATDAPPEGDTAASAAKETSVDEALAQKIAAENPDLKVVLPGSEEQITVREALARIAKEQQQDEQWAELVQVATECALGA